MANVRPILYIESSEANKKISIVKDMLPLEPVKYWAIGEKMTGENVISGAKRGNSLWSYELPEKKTTEVSIVLLPLLELLHKYKDQLLEINEKYGFDTYICVVVKHLNKQIDLEMSLDRKIIKLLAELGLRLEYDIYYYE